MSEEREWNAALVLNLIEKRNYSPRKALEHFSHLRKMSKERSTCHALVMETLKRLNLIDKVIIINMSKIEHQNGSILSLKKLEPKLKNLLRILVYRLKFEGHQPRLVFNTSQIILNRKNKHKFIKLFFLWLDLINDFSISDFLDNINDPIEQMALRYFQTYFFTKEIVTYYEDKAEEILSYLTKPSPVYLRQNMLKKTNNSSEFEKNRVELKLDEYMPDVYRVVKTDIPPARLTAVKNGYYYIQSRGSSFVSYFLEPKEREKILDCCAAPGSKTAHIASLTNNQAEIVAIDISPARIKAMGHNFEKLKVKSVIIDEGDSTNLEMQGRLFDKILIDAPCSGTGIIATKPYTKWRVKKPVMKKYSTIQKKILTNISEYLNPGGIIVYSTCSILPQENEEVISAFLEEKIGFETVPIETFPVGQQIPFNGLRLLPNEIESEGFTVFKIKKMTK